MQVQLRGDGSSPTPGSGKRRTTGPEVTWAAGAPRVTKGEVPCGARAVSTARCEPRASAFVNALYILERWLQAHCIGFSQPDAKASVGRSLTRGDGKRVAVTALLEAPWRSGKEPRADPACAMQSSVGPRTGAAAWEAAQRGRYCPQSRGRASAPDRAADCLFGHGQATASLTQL